MELAVYRAMIVFSGTLCVVYVFTILQLHQQSLTTRKARDGLRYKEVVEITKHDMEFSSTSPPISRKGQILCMIITMPDNLDTKAVHVKNTWGKRCDILLFMSSVRNDSFPTIGINVTEGRNHLVSKVIQGFHYIADNYLDTADWFLKADDDTYVITENLRHFLSKENSDTSILFGQKFLHYHENHTEEYFTGGPGYVLSKAALKLFAEATQNCRTTCGPQDGTTEDVKFTIYMHQLGAELGNSLDSLGRSRFHSFRFEEFLTRKQPNRIIERQFQGGEVGLETMSYQPISFHHMTPEWMYGMEYILYHLTPYGVTPENWD